MPHRTQMQVIKRRLVGKEGSERMRELRTILAELPNYRSGPYADIRKWVTAQIEETRTRSRVVHRDSIAVRREGAAQGVLVQLVEIPGLIEGASEGRGGGRALLGVLRDADAIVLCHDVAAPLDELEKIRCELDASDIELPTILAATKADEASPAEIERLAAALPDLELVAVSVLDEASLDAFREAVWRLTGLVRVFLRDDEPVALHPPITVLDVAHTIHHELAESCRGARVWGPSARFEGQRVGRDHLLADGDTVEILT